MGNTASAPTALALKFLANIAGTQPVGLEDPAWQSLFSFATPLVRFDPAEVQAEIRAHTASLVYHNAQTLNAQRLLFLLSQHLTKISSHTHSPSLATANAVLVVRYILKDLLEQLNTQQLMTFVEAPASGDMGAQLQAEFAGRDFSLEGGSLVATLAKAALGSLQHLPPAPTPAEYLLQLEVVHLMLVMASTQLYVPPAAVASPQAPRQTQHIFLEALAAQRVLAAPGIQALLQHFVASQAPPTGLTFYHPPEPRSALYFVRVAASTVFWLPVTAYALLRRGGTQQTKHTAEGSPLSDASICLLLTLYFYPPLDAAAGNPFRRALGHLQDADDDLTAETAAAEGGHGAAAGGAVVPYAALFEAIGRSVLARESTVLLLYALLHGTPHFNEYFMARSDVDTILLPILELLYNVRSRSANGIYMLLVVLLILSQAASFASNIHKIPLHSVPFYRERPLVDTTCGSLLAVLLLRTAHYNLAALKDVYLHTNTLATLANLAPHMTSISAHAAQRLVHLVHLLRRRFARLTAEQEKARAVAGGDTGAEAEQRSLELQLYSDFMRIVMEILNAILANALQSNPELVYAILHRREVFEPFLQDPKYADLMQNITTVADYFGSRVEAAIAAADGSGDVSAEWVLAEVKAQSRGWRKDKLRAFPELRFTYEEEASPEEFFAPYVWSLIVSNLSVPWTLSSITSFVPVEQGVAGEGTPKSPLFDGLTPRATPDSDVV